MKTSFTFLLLFVLLFSACDKNGINNSEGLKGGNDRNKILTDGLCIVSGEKVILNHFDFDYYDYSSHLIYLKDHMSFSDNIQGIGGFKVYANEEEIYSGQTHSGFFSYLPQGPVIIHTHPSFYRDYIIPLDFFYISDSSGIVPPDPREDERIVAALKKYNQFHAGLSCEINSVQYLSPENLKVELVLKNEDSFNYYYLDPNKTGIELFHYFTNGLFIRESDSFKSYTHMLDVAIPAPEDSWIDWLSVIKSNESKFITINYDNYEQVPNGDYEARFQFPGLSNIEKIEIIQKNGHVWLGKLDIVKEITIN